MHNCRIRFKNLHNICWKVCMNSFVMLWILSLILNFFSQTKDFYLFKLVWIFVTDLLNILVLVFKDYLVCLSINFIIFILNIIVLLCTLNSWTSLMDFSLSLKTFPWWYAMDIMFFFFVRIISSYCFIIAATSLGFSSLSSLPVSILRLYWNASFSAWLRVAKVLYHHHFCKTIFQFNLIGKKS